VDKTDNIIIDGVRYVGTPGLYELIFKRVLNDGICTEDKQKYKSMLLTTNAHRYNYDRIRGNRRYKHKYQICNRAVDVDRLRRNLKEDYLAQ